MLYKANEARCHKIPPARYKVVNWPEYDRALQQRGSLTVWVTPEALAAWHPPHTGQRGRPRDYSDVAIETGHGSVKNLGRWLACLGLIGLADAWPQVFDTSQVGRGHDPVDQTRPTTGFKLDVV